MPELKPGTVGIIASLILLIIYLGVLVLFSIWLAGTIVSANGMNVTTGVGLIATLLGSGGYLFFEIFLLANQRPPPILVVSLAILMMPLVVAKGLDSLSREYEHIMELLTSFPRFLSHLSPVHSS